MSDQIHTLAALEVEIPVASDQIHNLAALEIEIPVASDPPSGGSMFNAPFSDPIKSGGL